MIFFLILLLFEQTFLWFNIDHILKESRKIFQDVHKDFYSFDNIFAKFKQWREKFPDSYYNAYIGLCLQKILNPLIRLQLIGWNPLKVGIKSIIITFPEANIVTFIPQIEFINLHYKIGEDSSLGVEVCLMLESSACHSAHSGHIPWLIMVFEQMKQLGDVLTDASRWFIFRLTWHVNSLWRSCLDMLSISNAFCFYNNNGSRAMYHVATALSPSKASGLPS